MSRLNIKLPESIELSRRSLFLLSLLAFAGTLLKPLNILFASETNDVRSGYHPVIERERLKYFNLEQAVLVDDISAHIIPYDKDPGAREAGVVYTIDGIVAASNQHQGIYSRGLKVVNNLAIKLFSKRSFMALSSDEKIRILKAVETGAIDLVAGKKVQPDARAVRTGILFFALIKKQTFEAFYSDTMGWEMVGYDGPPQWKGNRDYSRCDYLD